MVSFLLIFVKDVRVLLKFNFSLKTILFLSLILILLIILEFFITNKENEKKNLKKIEILFGEKPNILYLFIICLLAAYFEELSFRAYLYIFFKIIFKAFPKSI